MRRSLNLPRIAFLGTGLMGSRIACRLLGAGYDVVVWNRTHEKTRSLVGRGAQCALAASAAVSGADLAFTMLEDGPVVGAVLFEERVAEALPKGALVIDMTSIPPSTAAEHSLRLSALGVAHLDAPVSGGTVGAEHGELAIFVGGAQADFDNVRGVLSAIGRPTYLGPSGSGQLAKCVNQLIVGATIGAIAEGLHLAAAGGLDLSALQNAMLGGFADSRILREHGNRMIDRQFAPGAKAATQLKDLDTALAVARNLDLQLPISTVVRRLFADLCLNGGVLSDRSALIVELERQSRAKLAE